MNDLIYYLEIILISLGFIVFLYYVIKKLYLLVTKSDKYKDDYEFHEKHKKLLLVGVGLVLLGIILSFFDGS